MQMMPKNQTKSFKYHPFHLIWQHSFKSVTGKLVFVVLKTRTSTVQYIDGTVRQLLRVLKKIPCHTKQSKVGQTPNPFVLNIASILPWKNLNGLILQIKKMQMTRYWRIIHFQTCGDGNFSKTLPTVGLFQESKIKRTNTPDSNWNSKQRPYSLTLTNIFWPKTIVWGCFHRWLANYFLTVSAHNIRK